MDPKEIQQPTTVFLDWVQKLIPKDKFKTFVSLFQFPTPNVHLCDAMYKELERVFDGRNPNYTYQFSNPDLLADWESYREDNLNEPTVWRRKGWEALRTATNSVLIVDIAEQEARGLPEPYFYFLGIENVIDFGYKGDDLEYLIAKQPDNKVAVFDDESYTVYQLNDKGEISEELINAPHDLGYCPARFFWDEPLNQKTPEIKKAPISPFLAVMDWLLFFSISKKHLDLYAPYPIYSAYESDCDFSNGETGEYCDGGYLRNQDDTYTLLASGTIQECPLCASKNLAGVGSFIEKPIPKDGETDLGAAVTITTIDKDSLQYNVDEVARLKAEVFTGVVGQGGDIMANKALNESQIAGNFESKVSILNNLKSNFEASMAWVDETICRLRYGQAFIGANISLGTEFYIYSKEELYAQFKLAKENGASEAELDAINSQILSTEYRNNPAQLQRMQILKQLEPYRHYTLEELLKLHEKQLLNNDLLQIKINFTRFVERFERENTNLREFGILLDFDKKIKTITDTFKTYANEQREPIRPGPTGD